MLDEKTAPTSRDDLAEPVAGSPDDPIEEVDAEQAATPPFDESITEEIGALIDDGKTYVEAEIAFQKTRASLAGKNVGKAIGFAVLAIILLHIAFLALAVGLVMALEPFVTIWGAIAIVVGALLLLTALLGLSALKRAKIAGAMFSSSEGQGADS